MKRHITDDPGEFFIVVDRDDKIVGFRTRAECHQDKSLTHRAISVVIFDKAGRVLLQKRSKTKDLQPGRWAISSAGHVAKGESYYDAAKRELKEELGVVLPLGFLHTWHFEDERESEMDALFQAHSDGPFYPNKEEIDEVAFFSKEELLKKIQSGKVVLSTWAVATLNNIGFIII